MTRGIEFMLDDTTLTLGAALKRCRISAGLTQQQLAEMVGVDHTFISHLERDRKDPSVKLLRRIASATGVPSGMFLALAFWVDLPDAERDAYRPFVTALLRLAEAGARPDEE